jgi:thermitase
MKKINSILATALFLSAVIASANEYIVKFKDSAITKQKSIAIKGLGRLPFVDTHEKAALAKVVLDQKSNQALALATLMKHPSVEYVVESFELKTQGQIDLTTLKDQWAIKKVEAEQAWNLAGNIGSQSVTVAVIDTGVDYKHENLKANMVPGYDFKDNDNDPFDDYDPNWQTSRKNPGHGTHCAGIVGATGVVEGGVVGLSPNVSIMPLRFLGKDGSGDLMAGIKAIDYAIEKKADIISASWGAMVSASQAQPLIEAVKRASDAGVIFIAAAGNGDQTGNGFSNDTKGMYPANANYENTITVAASDQNDAKTTFSNFGRKSVHLAAPGFKIMSTLPDNKYELLSGTSMATPLVSGLVALLKAQNKNLTGMQARSLLQQTAVKTSIETACNCRVSASSSMDALLNNKAVLVPYAYTLAPNETVKFSVMNAIGTVTYTSSNPQVASFDANGTLTGLTEGEVTVTATDSAGTVLKSDSIFVWTRTSAGGSCPLGDQALCDLMCQIMPDMPWCSK